MSTIDIERIVREVVAQELRPILRQQWQRTPDDNPSHRRAHRGRRNIGANGGRLWRKSDRLRLVEAMLSGATIGECAYDLGRSPKSIHDRLFHHKWGMFVHGEFGYRAVCEGTGQDLRLELDDAGQIGVHKPHTSAGFVDRDEFLRIFAQRIEFGGSPA